MRLFVIGHPITHSLSPAIHNAALRACGLPETYAALDVPADRLVETVALLRDPDVGGCNVTVPHKQAVMPLLDELSPEAARIGAVNTVAHRSGRLVGYNTDAAGFLASLRQVGVEAAGLRVVLLGAGGAARAIAFALVDAGVERLSIANRDAARAQRLADAVRRAARVGQEIEALELRPEALAAPLGAAQLVVNATSAGMDGATSPLPPPLVPSAGVACDIIYNPPETPFLRSARAAGARTINGLGMLVHQAAEAFTIWTGRPAPLAEMVRAAESALQRKGATA